MLHGSMEVAALTGLVALGVAVSQLASGRPVNLSGTSRVAKEGFRTLGVGILPQNMPPSDPAIPVPSEYYTIGIQQYLSPEEGIQVRDLNDRLNAMAVAGNSQGVQSLSLIHI